MNQPDTGGSRPEEQTAFVTVRGSASPPDPRDPYDPRLSAIRVIRVYAGDPFDPRLRRDPFDPRLQLERQPVRDDLRARV